MRTPKPCSHDGCERPRLDGAIFCGEHVGVRHRCRRKRLIDGKEQRCKKQALVGLLYCEKHGGRFPQSQAQSERAIVFTAMQRFVVPYEGPLNPVGGFEMLFRMCLGKIAWYSEQIALIPDAKDLIWGVTKQENIGAGEFAGVNTTYEARVHLLEELQFRERKHLLELEKVWIGQGLERERLDLLRVYANKTFDLVKQALEALDIDTDDPKVRETLARVFLNPETILSEPKELA
jgi:hypothetical protein